jgi:F-type H+-transporting ATPase subunit delta
MAETDLRAAKRYATALFGIATREDSLTTIESDLTSIVELIDGNAAFRQVWETPLIPAGRKRELVNRVLGGSVNPLTLAFVLLLVDKRREEILRAVRMELQALSDSSRHLVRAEATFATPPTAAEQAALVQSLQQRTGSHVDLTVNVDASIIGGIVVRLQDTILDGSVRGTLERLREQLLTEG